MRLVGLASLGLLLACTRDDVRASADAATDAGVAVPPAPSASAGKPSRTQLGAFSHALAEGRDLGHDKRWPEAVTAFEKALALEPENVVALNELGWAAFNAGDDTRAKRANARALALHPPPELEAQALYNEGRRLEALGQLDRAKSAYERSLAARENDAVQKRLDGLFVTDAGVKLAPDAGAPSAKVPCTSAPGDEPELRRCLEAYVAGSTSEPFFFAPEAASGLPPGILLFRFGAAGKTPVQTSFALVAPTKTGLLPLALIGPAYGTTALKMVGFEKKNPTTWFVTATSSRIDQNLSGLEVREESSELLTVCVVGAAPSCPVQVPLRLRSKLAYPNASDLDADEQAVVQDRIRDLGPPYDHQTQLAAALLGNNVQVTLTSGKKEDVPHGVLGAHSLR